MRRRSFLQYLSLGAIAAPACDFASSSSPDDPGDTDDGGGGKTDAFESDAIDASTFAFGVMAGDMEAVGATSARAILWTRTTSSQPLYLLVWEKGTSTLAFDRRVGIAEDGFVHVDVETLRPGARYRYQFHHQDAAGAPLGYSSAGELATPPAPGTRPVLRFGAASCTHQAGAAGFRAVAHAAGESLDCFFHLGDHVYNDARTWLTTLAEFRDGWAECFALPYMRELHAAHGIYFTWDDHEIINNWDWDWVDANPEYVPSVVNGTRTYFEHHPIRRDTVEPDRLWRSVKWGDTAELFILDLRSERREDVGRRMLSRAQLDWLKHGLASSTAMFKFVINPIPVCTMPPEDAHVADRWEGFAAERDELLGWIRDRHLEGVWWISGDYHVGAVGQIEQYGYRWYGMQEVMMGPGAGHGAEIETASMAAYTDAASGERQWPFTTDASNYLVITADPDARSVRVQFVDGAGEVIHDQTYARDFAPPPRTVAGAIAAKHAQRQSVLGDALTDAHPTLGATGTWQQFRYGYIYASTATGAYALHGPILDYWADEGWSQSWLGFPVTDVYKTTAGDDEQEFEHGWVTRRKSTGAIVTRAKA